MITYRKEGGNNVRAIEKRTRQESHFKAALSVERNSNKAKKQPRERMAHLNSLIVEISPISTNNEGGAFRKIDAKHEYDANYTGCGGLSIGCGATGKFTTVANHDVEVGKNRPSSNAPLSSPAGRALNMA
jgi:hypothetical protein